MTGRWTSTATSPGARTCSHAWTAAASPALAGAPVASGLAWWESGWYAVVWIIFGGVGMLAICLGPWIYLAWKAGMLEERPHRREKETGLRCLWCGKRIGGGRFCTGTHYNLFVARYGRADARRRG